MTGWRLLRVTTALLVLPATGLAQAPPQDPRTQALERLGALLAPSPPAAPQLPAPGSPAAPPSVQDNVSRMVKGLRRTQIESAVLDPLGVSTQNSLDPQVTITADKKDGVTGHARFGLAIGERWGASATFAAPLSSGGATFVDAAGLKSTASIAAAITFLPQRVELPVRPDGCKAQLVTDLLAAQSVQSSSETDRRTAVADALERMRLQARAQDPSAPEVRSLVGQLGHSQLQAILSSPTIVATPERFWAAVNQEPTLVCVRFWTQLTAGFEANHHSIDYLAPDATRATFDDTSRAWTVAYGFSHSKEWHPEEGKNILTPVFYGGISLRNGDKISADDAKDFCVPLASGASECFNGPPSAPVIGDRRTTIVVEARVWNYRQTAGFNPKYTWAQTADGHGDTWEVPIYLMRQVTDVSQPDLKFGASLIGGVNPGWRQGASSGNGWFVTIFLTKPFGLP